MSKAFWKYGMAPLDYFYLRSFLSPLEQAHDYANTWEMHLFHQLFNERAGARLLRDKGLFRNHMGSFTSGECISLQDDQVIDWLKSRSGRRVVAKDPLGAAGSSVSFHQVSTTGGRVWVDSQPVEQWLAQLQTTGRRLIEDYLEQHRLLMELHPSSLNTVRIVTFMPTTKQVDFWAALLRIGNNTEVDNFDAGGITALVNLNSGIVEGPPIQKDPFLKRLTTIHPATGKSIVGLQLPFWPDVLALVERAAAANPHARTVGWDVAILRDGPALLEGNDNWDKTHYQLGTQQPIGDRIRSLVH